MTTDDRGRAVAGLTREPVPMTREQVQSLGHVARLFARNDQFAAAALIYSAAAALEAAHALAEAESALAAYEAAPTPEYVRTVHPSDNPWQRHYAQGFRLRDAVIDAQHALLALLGRAEGCG